MTPKSPAAQSLASVGTALLLAAAICIGAYYFIFTGPALAGTIFVSASQELPIPALYAYSVPELSEVVPPVPQFAQVGGVEQREVMRSIVMAPDGTVAYLGKAEKGWEVFTYKNGNLNQLTFTTTIKRDLRLALDGKSLLYAELPLEVEASSTRAASEWRIMRLARSGEQESVGKGVRPHELADGTYIALTNEGLAQLYPSGAEPTLLVPSAVYISDAAIAASPAGKRIAWVNPADNSLQIFEKSSEGTYNSILVLPAMSASSLTFNQTGTLLALGRGTSTSTEVTIVDPKQGTARLLGTVAGTAEITDWNSFKIRSK